MKKHFFDHKHNKETCQQLCFLQHIKKLESGPSLFSSYSERPVKSAVLTHSNDPCGSLDIRFTLHSRY